MKDPVPYGLRPKYDHMKPADVTLWEEFIRNNPAAYDQVIYDQPVGEGAPVPEGTSEEMDRDWKILNQWKIDVIGFSPGRRDIIEIKPRAGTSALGQVIAYAKLFAETDDSGARVRPVIITDEIRPDMPKLAESLRVVLLTTKPS